MFCLKDVSENVIIMVKGRGMSCGNTLEFDKL